MKAARDALSGDQHVVVATGCPLSGWEMVVPMLEKAGMEPVNADIERWYDEQFKNYTKKQLLENKITPERDSLESLVPLLGSSAANPCLIADSRSVWLLNLLSERIPKITFLLFYTSPSTALAHALINSLEPRAFLKFWRSINQSIIDFQTYNRRQTILMDAEAAIKYPRVLIESCKKFGLNSSLISESFSATTPELRPLDHFLIAGLTASKTVHDIQMELEARALPVKAARGESDSEIDILLNWYEKQDVVQKKLEENNNKLTEENELLLMQLHQLQEELENYFQKYQESRLENERLLEIREQEYQNSLSGKIKRLILFIISPYSRLRQELTIRKHIRIIDKSGLFDKAWYLEKYKDVANAGMKPIRHYYMHGYKESRNPSDKFNTSYYLNNNPDVKESGINPLLHYILYGKSENRKPLPE